jgi:hypothetical protein
MDFNPLGGTTSPLLFEWEELLAAGAGVGDTGAEVPELRLVAVGAPLRPAKALYGAPYDFVNGTGVVEDFLEQLHRRQGEEDEDDCCEEQARPTLS